MGIVKDSVRPIPIPVEKSRSVLPTTTVTAKNAKTKNYASGIGNSRLAALCSQAFDLKGTPYLRDACDVIVDQWQRDRLERRDAENRWLEGLGL